MKKQIQVVAAFALAIGSSLHAQQAVQWRVQDGGNGHWYERVPRTAESWDVLKSSARARGADLASVSSGSENSFVQVVAFPPGASPGHAAIGGERPGGACGSPWRWSDGIQWTYSNWDPGQPECAAEEIDLMYSYGRWHDYPRTGFVGVWTSAVIEWSADCNADGIVDYGQILQGQLPDTNTNGIPDGCECTTSPTLPACCTGDLNQDRAVDGADLGILLNAWGTCNGVCPADLNRDGFVNGSDLGMLLGRWGTCS